MGKKSKKHPLTHRCAERHQDCGIRYLTGLFNGWHLMKREYNWDWDTNTYLPVVKINYCPFCGKELEEVNRNGQDE